MPHRTLITNATQSRIGLRGTHNHIGFLKVRTLFLDHNRTPQRDNIGLERHIFDQDTMGQTLGHFPNTDFQKCLRVFGLFVPGVFPQIPMRDGFLQSGSDFLAPYGSEFLQFLFQLAFAFTGHRD